MSDIPDWVDNLPMGTGIQSKRKWAPLIKIGIHIMREKRMSSKEAVEAIVINENLKGNEVVNFRTSFNRHLRRRRLKDENYPM